MPHTITAMRLRLTQNPLRLVFITSSAKYSVMTMSCEVNEIQKDNCGKHMRGPGVAAGAVASV